MRQPAGAGIRATSKRSMHQRAICASVEAGFGLALALAPAAGAGDSPYAYLTQMDLRDLTNITVTIASRKAETLQATPAAVSVVTGETLRRTGATTVADALRLVPGLQVARMEANKWAITSRGFNGRYARHMLVQVDGRTVYNPLMSGVFWEVQDPLLTDIARIEVVRGPGGTMWGANAVNGVVNIVSKPAAETLGTEITTGIGTEERAFGSIRYGAHVADTLDYRVYLKAFERDAGAVGDADGHDDWRQARGGGRVDWTPGAADTLTLAGDTYAGRARQLLLLPDAAGFLPVPETVEMRGNNLRLRWQHDVSAASDWILQSYYDYTERDEVTYGERRHTADLDFQHRFPLHKRHELLWGFGYRWTGDRLRASETQWYTDDRHSDVTLSAFVQDEIALVEDRLKATLGSKLEHNDYTGYEPQPNARLAFTPHAALTTWAAYAHAVRTPSRVERSMRLLRTLQRPGMTFFGQPTLPAMIMGDAAFGAERLNAYELGQRVQALENLAFDLAAFYNAYYDVQSVEPQAETLPAPFALRNGINGTAYGFEGVARWQPLAWWTLRGAYTVMTLDLQPDPGSADIFTEETFEEDIPLHQASLLSCLNLPGHTELNLWLRYVDEIPIEALDAYLELDASLTWFATRRLEFAVVGQNLLNGSHYEYGPSFLLTTQSTEVERGVYGRMTLRF